MIEKNNKITNYISYKNTTTNIYQYNYKHLLCFIRIKIYHIKYL